MISLKTPKQPHANELGDGNPSAWHVIAAFAPCSAWVAVDVASRAVIAEAGAVDERLRQVAVDQVRGQRSKNGLRKVRARTGFADLIAVSLDAPGESAFVVTLARLSGEAPFDAVDLAGVRTKLHALRSPKKVATEPEAVASLASIRRRAPVSAFIVDRDLVVISSSLREEHMVAIGEVDTPQAKPRIRLPIRLERIVRDAMEDWPEQFADDSHELVVPLGPMVIRLVPMRGRFNDHIGIFMERARSAAHIEAMAARYQISSRELEVARLLIKGLSAEEVGSTMSIAETTVVAHVRNIINKTDSRNRTEAIAKLLGR